MDKCTTLKDEIERLIRVGYFKDFVDDPQSANQVEQPQQRCLEKVCEVLTIIGGLHLAKESYHTCDKYTNGAKNLALLQVHKIDVGPTKRARREFEDIVFREADARWVHHPHVDALVITA